MDFDDIVYLGLLFFSISFGYYYRTIQDKQQKKLIGSIVGFIIVLIVSGFHIVHTFITILVNAFIILYTSKKTCHLSSFVFSFLYLFFFRTTVYFGIPYPPGHTNLVQMMLTLKLVGLAFEVNQVYLSKKNVDKTSKEIVIDDEYNYIEPNLIDIFHYSFNYIGVLTGPYYRYRTFMDYFDLPFSKHASWKDFTIDKIKYVPLYAGLFLFTTYTWPLSYALSDEFDNERSWLYRFWYIWPNFFTFRMRIYIGLVLSECVCTMAGLGAYPEKSEPKPGNGPSNAKEIQAMIKSPNTLKDVQYNFDTIVNVKPYSVEICTTFREAMKHWNICIQYWLAMYIYKRFPSKKYRTIVTMLVSAVWHGVYTGYYVCIGGAPFYLLIEDVWTKLVLKGNQGMSLKVWEWIVSGFKMFGFSYLAIAFHLMTLDKIWHYYNSIYHAGLLIGIILYVSGFMLLKKKRAMEKRLEQNLSQAKKRE